MAKTLLTKWDYDLAFALYCGGSTYDQILQNPKFHGMSKSALTSRASSDKWFERREKLSREEKSGFLHAAAKRLQERLYEEGIKHQDFMLDQIQIEREQFSMQDDGPENQAARLSILAKLDDLARRTSKLDEEKRADPMAQGFQILVHLQSSPQRDARSPSTGILRSNNAMLEEVNEAEYEEIQPTGLEAEQAQRMPDPSELFVQPPISS